MNVVLLLYTPCSENKGLTLNAAPGSYVSSQKRAHLEQIRCNVQVHDPFPKKTGMSGISVHTLALFCYA